MAWKAKNSSRHHGLSQIKQQPHENYTSGGEWGGSEMNSNVGGELQSVRHIEKPIIVEIRF